mmetsp:Transcript_27810/g.65368  ORF Transcript_27810/g.65368 Transcript_27810/m.65368 type:complete len:217 (-) Transcript_27810:640-1290(-)
MRDRPDPDVPSAGFRETTGSAAAVQARQRSGRSQKEETEREPPDRSHPDGRPSDDVSSRRRRRRSGRRRRRFAAPRRRRPGDQVGRGDRHEEERSTRAVREKIPRRREGKKKSRRHPSLRVGVGVVVLRGEEVLSARSSARWGNPEARGSAGAVLVRRRRFHLTPPALAVVARVGKAGLRENDRKKPNPDCPPFRFSLARGTDGWMDGWMDGWIRK